MEMENVLFAFGLTLFAGLSTGVGSALAFFTKKTNTRFLAFTLGLSAGVMIYVSMVEIYFKAREALQADLGEARGAWVTAAAFFLGMFAVMLIDKFVPSHENPHELHRVEEMRGAAGQKGQENALMRMGILTALAIAIHNFPEGIATFMAAIQEPRLGIPIAAAIAVHNIPEGIAVSVPVYSPRGAGGRPFGSPSSPAWRSRWGRCSPISSSCPSSAIPFSASFSPPWRGSWSSSPWTSSSPRRGNTGNITSPYTGSSSA